VVEMRAALRSAVCILGLIDLPPGPTRTCAPAEFLGEVAWFPTGLLQLARLEHAPVAVFTVGFDRMTGQRKLHIRRLPAIEGDSSDAGNAARGLQGVGRGGERAILADAPAWHAWADLPLFRQAPSRGAGRGGDGNA